MLAVFYLNLWDLNTIADGHSIVSRHARLPSDLRDSAFVVIDTLENHIIYSEVGDINASKLSSRGGNHPAQWLSAPLMSPTRA